MGLLDALSDPQFRRDIGTNANQLAQSMSNTAASTVTAPVDALAWLLRKARVPVPSNPFGGSEWAAQQGLTQDVPMGAPRLAGETLGLLAPMAGSKEGAAAIAHYLRMAEKNMAAPRTMNPQAGAIVWHGSPHKFDKFDASKIGTGEGAQAYGHGLYLAESPKIANTYKRKLSDSQLLLNGKPLDDQYDALRKTYGEDVGAFIEYAADNGLTDAKQLLRGYLHDPSGLKYFGDPAIGTNSSDAVSKALRVLKNAENKSLGNLYKVDLPDDQIARMLDWDKPLSAQPQIIDAIRKNATLGENSSGWKGAPSGMFDRQFNNAERNGEYLYRDMLSNTPQAADELRRMGIPGIRYLDGGSRGAGQGSSNFVVFPGNENMLKILERNGQPMGLLNRPGRYTGEPIVNASSPFDSLPYHAMREELIKGGEKRTLAERTSQSIDDRLAKQAFDSEMRAAYEELYGAIPKNASIEEIAAKVRPYVFKATQEAQQSGNPFFKAFTNSGKYVGNQ